MSGAADEALPTEGAPSEPKAHRPNAEDSPTVGCEGQHASRKPLSGHLPKEERLDALHQRYGKLQAKASASAKDFFTLMTKTKELRTHVSSLEKECILAAERIRDLQTCGSIDQDPDMQCKLVQLTTAHRSMDRALKQRDAEAQQVEALATAVAQAHQLVHAEAKAIRSEVKKVLTDAQCSSSPAEALPPKATAPQKDSLQAAAPLPYQEVKRLSTKGLVWHHEVVCPASHIPQQAMQNTAIDDKSQLHLLPDNKPQLQNMVDCNTQHHAANNKFQLQYAVDDKPQLQHTATNSSQQCVLKAADSEDSGSLQPCLTSVHPFFQQGTGQQSPSPPQQQQEQQRITQMAAHAAQHAQQQQQQQHMAQMAMHTTQYPQQRQQQQQQQQQHVAQVAVHAAPYSQQRQQQQEPSAVLAFAGPSQQIVCQIKPILPNPEVSNIPRDHQSLPFPRTSFAVPMEMSTVCDRNCHQSLLLPRTSFAESMVPPAQDHHSLPFPRSTFAVPMEMSTVSPFSHSLPLPRTSFAEPMKMTPAQDHCLHHSHHSLPLPRTSFAAPQQLISHTSHDPHSLPPLGMSTFWCDHHSLPLPRTSSARAGLLPTALMSVAVPPVPLNTPHLAYFPPGLAQSIQQPGGPVPGLVHCHTTSPYPHHDQGHHHPLPALPCFPQYGGHGNHHVMLIHSYSHGGCGHLMPASASTAGSADVLSEVALGNSKEDVLP